MRKPIILFILYFFIITSISFGQQTQRVTLNKRIKDDKIKKSLAIIPVYKYESKAIAPYTMFGIERKPEQKDLIIRKFPLMENIHDTGYSYIYFSGADNDVNKGYCLTLIGNFIRSIRTIYFFTDKNNNLDFTDDGPPDSIDYFNFSTTIAFKNTNNSAATHHVKLTRIEYGKNYKYNHLLTEYYKKHSGNKKFVSINYSFREQRFNTIGGVYSQGNDSFLIALKDMNSNGLFNESCKDKFYIGATNELISTEIMTKINSNFNEMFFEWNKKRYRIVSIDPAGAYLDFIEIKGEKLNKELKIGKPVQNFSFVTIKNEEVELKRYKKHEVFIFFWDRSTISDEDTLYLGKIHSEFNSKIKVITLNHGDLPRKVRIMQFYNDIVWPIGFSSTRLGRSFFVEELTKGFYLGKRCKLISDNITPKEMYELISSK